MNDEHQQELERLRAQVDQLERNAEAIVALAEAALDRIELRGRDVPMSELDSLLRNIRLHAWTPEQRLLDRMSSEAGCFRVVKWGDPESEDPGQSGRE